MDGPAQLAWIASAIDALEGIHAEEVRSISAELRRTVTRPAQIVPEISRLVADLRKRRTATAEPSNPTAAAERAIDEGYRKRLGDSKTQDDVEEAWRWQRNARKAACLHVDPIPPPLTRAELDHMPDHIRSLGQKNGFLVYRDGKLHERELKV